MLVRGIRKQHGRLRRAPSLNEVVSAGLLDFPGEQVEFEIRLQTDPKYPNQALRSSGSTPMRPAISAGLTSSGEELASAAAISAFAVDAKIRCRRAVSASMSARTSRNGTGGRPAITSFGSRHKYDVAIRSVSGIVGCEIDTHFIAPGWPESASVGTPAARPDRIDCLHPRFWAIHLTDVADAAEFPQCLLPKRNLAYQSIDVGRLRRTPTQPQSVEHRRRSCVVQKSHERCQVFRAEAMPPGHAIDGGRACNPRRDSDAECICGEAVLRPGSCRAPYLAGLRFPHRQLR